MGINRLGHRRRFVASRGCCPVIVSNICARIPMKTRQRLQLGDFKTNTMISDNFFARETFHVSVRIALYK